MYDVAINNGMVIDPANRIQAKLNLGIRDGRIACLSLEPQAGEKIIDAAGLVVVPGFIDMHMHEDTFDGSNFSTTIFECMLRMGVTTVIGGNCGIGPDDPGHYLAAADRAGLPVNVGLYAAHSAIRRHFVTDNYKPAPAELFGGMAAELDAQLAAGCVGVSFGLRYVPGTNWAELQALAAVAAKRGKLIAAHARDDAAKIGVSVQELIDTAKEQGVRVQISHIGSMAAFGQMEDVLSMVDNACANQLDVGLDCYPYNAFCTHIGSATYDPGFLERYNIGYDAIEVTGGKYRGLRCNEALFNQVRTETPEILAVAHVMQESEIDRALAHPRVILASDGVLVDGFGHPRAAGSFPRFIHQYVKGKKLLSLSEAIAKMTCLPASRVGIKKGDLAPGSDADIVIFDENSIRDTADFQEPRRQPLGIKWVMIAGVVAMQDGGLINGRLGRAVRV